MPKCSPTYEYLQYDGTNGQDVCDLIAAHESNLGVTWSVTSDTGTVLTINLHGDGDQPYEILLNQYVVCGGTHWDWQSAPLDPADFAERYATV